MCYFDEIEKKHEEQYETDPIYKAEFDAKQVEWSAELEQREAQEVKARIEAGRYTLDEAARFIEDNSTAIYGDILTELVKSANNGELPFYKPGSNAKFNKRTAVLDWYEEFFWDDLNKWIEENEPRLGCSFPNPETGGDDGKDSQPTKPRKKLKLKERDTNEGLLLLYEMFDFYKVKYLDQLPGPMAWGKIVSKEFTSDLIKSISDTQKSITLNGGEKLNKEGFLEKYRKRFK